MVITLDSQLLLNHLDTSEKGVRLMVDQAFGNCPQYIQTRELDRVNPTTMPASHVEELVQLDSRAQTLIQQSDTFFVASSVSNGSGEASQSELASSAARSATAIFAGSVTGEPYLSSAISLGPTRVLLTFSDRMDGMVNTALFYRISAPDLRIVAAQGGAAG